jgi:AcrR family transcriptional regulator
MAVPTKDQILDAALSLAAESQWEAVRLHQVAARLSCTLTGVHAQFREKEDLVDAWFDRADRAMLAAAANPELQTAPARARLRALLWVWLMALAAHQRATREMIAGKFEFGHVHFQAAGLLRVSRTVQWWREAAGRTAVLPWRAFEETGLTAIYLAVFARWLNDRSDGFSHTGQLLDRLLDWAQPLARWRPQGNGGFTMAQGKL